MSTLYSLDRFEDNDLAVLEREDGLSVTLPRTWLPAGVREGDVLKVDTAQDLSEVEPGDLNAVYFEIDDAATRERLERARALRRRLPRGPEGAVDL